jgi:hypothetical protein
MAGAARIPVVKHDHTDPELALDILVAEGEEAVRVRR